MSSPSPYSQKLRAIGVVPGVDMTAEAALAKLSHLLASGQSREKVKELMSTNLRGELTVLDSMDHKLSLKSSIFLREVANTLNISSSKVWRYAHWVRLFTKWGGGGVVEKNHLARENDESHGYETNYQMKTSNYELLLKSRTRMCWFYKEALDFLNKLKAIIFHNMLYWSFFIKKN